MIDISTLQNKYIHEMTDEEQDAIRQAYLGYFRRLHDPRKTAIGFMVIAGGIPGNRIGEVMIRFEQPNVFTDDQGVGVGFSFGPFPLLFDQNTELWQVIRNYILSDARFAGPLKGVGVGIEGLSLPLIACTKNSRCAPVGAPLRNCKTLMNDAGRAVGFNASKIKLYQLGNMIKFPESFVWEQGSGFKFQEKPINQFPFSILKTNNNRI